MTSRPLEQVTCNRCQCVEVLCAPNDIREARSADWSQIRAFGRDGKTIVADPDDEEKPADLCPECTEALWQFMNPKLAEKLEQLKDAAEQIAAMPA